MIDFQAMGARVAALRRSAEINSQEELAAQLSAMDGAPEKGWGRPAIAGLESGGDRPGLLLAVALADRFRVPMDWLLGRKTPLGGPLVGEFVEDPDELALVHFWRSLEHDQRILATQLLRIPGLNPSST